MSLFGDDAAGRIASRMLVEDEPPPGVEELHPMSVRVPESVKTVIDSMAAEASLSRNSMCIHLLKAGIESVVARLPDSFRSEWESELRGQGF